MPKFELPEEDLQKYAQKIRKIFNIEEVEDNEIDYDALNKIPKEIDRRRCLFRYFIPNVFAPGRYDRRADLIDGCIYCMEIIEKTGNQSLIYKFWAERAKVKKNFAEEDVETDSYGYIFYHPILSIIGMGDHLDVLIPSLVKHICCFKGRKRKLDLNDYSLIFFSSFNSVSPVRITPKMCKFLHQLSHEFHKRPLADSIKIKGLMEKWGYKDAHTLHSQINKIGLRVHCYFEKLVFGLESFLFHCDYPNHVRAKIKNRGLRQTFLTGGKTYTQVVAINLPIGADWNRVYRKFPLQTRCCRMVGIPTFSQEPFKYFNPNLQDWNFPWSTIVDDWHSYLNELEKNNRAIEVFKPKLKPTKYLVQICSVLEQDGNIKNSTLRRRLKISSEHIEQIQQIRKNLDMNALIARDLLIYYHKLTDVTHITFPGDEEWKYQLLKKLGEASNYFSIALMEDLSNSHKFLTAFYIHTPYQGIMFQKAVKQVLQGKIDYIFQKQLLRAGLGAHWAESFDIETESWQWNPNEYEVTPIKFRIK